MENWRNIIPIGFILPFVIIIVIEFGVLYGLNFYKQILQGRIDNLKNDIKTQQSSLAGSLEDNESYQVFSQMVNLLEILNRKHSIVSVLDEFNKIMPKFVTIKNFNYDAESNKISISGNVPDWESYVRFHQYINNLKDLRLDSFTSPTFDEKNNIVNFSMVLVLNQSFYQKK
jgi:hypothetical protein